MNSKYKGSLAVSQCVRRMYEHLYEVLLPFGDRMPYDLVVDNGKQLFKVQCKFAGKNSKGFHEAHLRTQGGNQSYHTSKKYADDAFDWLYVYTEDGRHFLFEWKDVKARNVLKVDSPRYAHAQF